jgi:hypothetical protein
MTPDTEASIAIVHDGQGTWFAPTALVLTLLTPDQLHALRAGEEWVLREGAGTVNVGELLNELVQEPTIKWTPPPATDDS